MKSSNIGGQAVMEGVMMRNADKYAVAVRKTDGEIVVKTEEYKELLVSYIAKAARFADGNPLTIYINSSDEDKKEFLEKRTGMTVTVSEEDFLGGIRSVIPGRNILIDHSFSGALEKEYEEFTFKGGVTGE